MRVFDIRNAFLSAGWRGLCYSIRSKRQSKQTWAVSDNVLLVVLRSKDDTSIYIYRYVYTMIPRLMFVLLLVQQAKVQERTCVHVCKLDNETLAGKLMRLMCCAAGCCLVQSDSQFRHL